MCCTLTAHFSGKESLFDLYTVSIVPNIVYDIVLYFVYRIQYRIRYRIRYSCTLCPTGHLGDTRSHKSVSLVFFSTFEPISLTPDSCMQRKGVPMLYERAASQVPSLYVCPVENVLGRVPLIPCYLNGNSANTIPHCFRGKIPREASADSRPDSGTGSRLFEINMWMWRYGRTFPRQISVDQAVELRKKRVQESRARGAETLRRRRDSAWVKGASAPQ